jgi:hypothetical protein
MMLPAAGLAVRLAGAYRLIAELTGQVERLTALNERLSARVDELEASPPVRQLRDPGTIRAALDALAVRLDGRLAAANTIARKRAVFHGALAYAAELGLLPGNPLDRAGWKAPTANTAVNPLTVVGAGSRVIHT